MHFNPSAKVFGCLKTQNCYIHKDEDFKVWWICRLGNGDQMMAASVKMAEFPREWIVIGTSRFFSIS